MLYHLIYSVNSKKPVYASEISRKWPLPLIDSASASLDDNYMKERWARAKERRAANLELKNKQTA
jgi:hypothetical protein